MRKLAIAFGDSRRAKVWRNTELSFDELCEMLEDPVRTAETVEEYHQMTRDEKSELKDLRPFVCGYLRDGKRKAEYVEYRSMLSLDGDSVTPEFITSFRSNMRYASCLYSTHGSTPEKPRCRILVPLTRDVTPREFNALSRLFAAELGIDMFDKFSHRVNQPMFISSVPRDGEFVFIVTKGEWLDPDRFLEKYPSWTDETELPRTSDESITRSESGKMQEDPLLKEGVVGAFCRAYTITEAIEKFLPDIYGETVNDDRYDYLPGEGSSGMVVYDDKFAYSHHASDPAGQREVNAFDLVRLHKFKDPDEKSSFQKMADFAMQDEKVRAELATKDFSQVIDTDHTADDGWDDPLPFAQADLPAFPVEALPDVLGRFAAAVARSTQTPVDMAANSVLTVVSACMRNLYKVEGKADWHEPTNIFNVNIADPSERKTAVITMAVKAVNKFVKEYNERHKVEYEMSRATKQKLENRKNSLLSSSRKKGEDKSAEEFNDALRSVIEQLAGFHEIKPLKIYVDDTTPEKLTETLAENGNAISIISSEGGIFDVLSGTYSSKVNIDVFLKAYSGETILVERIMRSSVYVEEACLTILLSVQPIVIEELMKNKKFRHRGLTARFLYSFPKSFVGERSLESDPVPEDVYLAYEDLIYNILSETRGTSPEIIRLTPEAREVLIGYNDWVEKLLADEYSVYSDWLGKLVGNTLRIAGILARASVLKRDVGDALLQSDDPVMIDKATMENAIKIGRYYFVHAINAYSSMGVSSDYKSTLMVLNKIKQNRLTAVTRRDIMRLCRWIGSADEAQSVINHLEDYGFVRLSAIDNSDKLRTGRPKNGLYTVNPHIYKR